MLGSYVSRGPGWEENLTPLEPGSAAGVGNQTHTEVACGNQVTKQPPTSHLIFWRTRMSEHAFLIKKQRITLPPSSHLTIII